MSRARLPFVRTFALALVLLSAFAAANFACGTSAPTDTLVPITGIVVRAESLTVGRGCGTGPTQIYKYVALVLGLNVADVAVEVSKQRRDELIAVNVYDCFTDGLFVDLPPSGGSSDYDVQIYAYNRTAYEAAGGDTLFRGITQRLQVFRSLLLNDGGAAERGAIDADLKRLRATNPTYTTTCTAVELANVQSLAVCKPFAAGGTGVGMQSAPATITLSAASFTRAQGGALTCGVEYTSVRYRSGAGGAVGAATDAACAGLTITVSPATAPASWSIEVALLDGTGALVGQTTCGAETSPGLTTAAVCKPIP